MRDYGTPAQIWGGNPDCGHTWITENIEREMRRGVNLAQSHVSTRGGAKKIAAVGIQKTTRGFCTKCEAWLGSLGNEPTPELFIEHLVLIFREVWRTLRDDGTIWVNMGDSYCSTAPGSMGDPLPRIGTTERVSAARAVASQKFRPNTPSGMKPKDLVGIPWMLALALRADGWYLRRDIIWSKPNPMPESVNDRPSTSHEYIFLLTKSEDYFYDAEAVREEQSGGTHPKGTNSRKKEPAPGSGNRSNTSFNDAIPHMLHPEAGRNRRSVWTISTKPYKEAHFATFPPEIPEICIRAGTSQKGACPKCLTPWERVIDKRSLHRDQLDRDDPRYRPGRYTGKQATLRDPHYVSGKYIETQTVGWIPGCEHYGLKIENTHMPHIPDDAVEPIICATCAGAGRREPLPMFPEQDEKCPACHGSGEEAPANKPYLDWENDCAEIQYRRLELFDEIKRGNFQTVPCIVADPFLGSGTTIEVAKRLGRDYIGFELNEQYANKLATDRVQKIDPLFDNVDTGGN